MVAGPVMLTVVRRLEESAIVPAPELLHPVNTNGPVEAADREATVPTSYQPSCVTDGEIWEEYEPEAVVYRVYVELHALPTVRVLPKRVGTDVPHWPTSNEL